MNNGNNILDYFEEESGEYEEDWIRLGLLIDLLIGIFPCLIILALLALLLYKVP